MWGSRGPLDQKSNSMNVKKTPGRSFWCKLFIGWARFDPPTYCSNGLHVLLFSCFGFFFFNFHKTTCLVIQCYTKADPEMWSYLIFCYYLCPQLWLKLDETFVGLLVVLNSIHVGSSHFKIAIKNPFHINTCTSWFEDLTIGIQMTPVVFSLGWGGSLYQYGPSFYEKLGLM